MGAEASFSELELKSSTLLTVWDTKWSDNSMKLISHDKTHINIILHIQLQNSHFIVHAHPWQTVSGDISVTISARNIDKWVDGNKWICLHELVIVHLLYWFIKTFGN